jgi:hypothetical protein
MSEPTFLVCGGQRCGTTAVWHLLNDHPDVFLAQPVSPEPKFFLSDENGTIADYEQQYFSDTQRASAVGEKSTSYFEMPGTAERIAAAYPDIRLVFILRHPAERAVSNFLFSVAGGFETRTFDEAMKGANDPAFERKRVQLVSPFDYIKRGRYAERLKPFHQYFSANHLLYLFFDDLVAAPESLCRSLYNFLGVDADFHPPSLGTVANSGAAWPKLMSQQTLTELIKAFADSNESLSRLTGRDLECWTRPTERLLECLN